MKYERLFKTATVVVFCFLAWLPMACASDAARPDFVLILADDVTHNNLGCCGGRNVPTPNIDHVL